MSGYNLPDWVVLLKFGKHTHLDEFRRDGLLHMNSQAHFAKLEDDRARSDRFEGTDKIYQPTYIESMTIENHVDGSTVVIPPEDLAGPILVGLNKSHCNIFCMFGLTEPIEIPLVDERNFAFGDSFVLVLNTQKFLDRFYATAKEHSFQYECRPVEYYDCEAHSGETGVFRKPSTFKYQNEFRLAIAPGSVNPVRLTIGSLEDITTEFLPLRKINSLLDFGTQKPKK